MLSWRKVFISGQVVLRTSTQHDYPYVTMVPVVPGQPPPGVQQGSGRLYPKLYIKGLVPLPGKRGFTNQVTVAD